MEKCLIITAQAEAFADHLCRLSAADIPVKPCLTAKQALAEFSGETVLFGNPDMVVEVLPEMPGIKWVQSTWAGVKPFIELGRRDYLLTGVKDVFGTQMAEYSLGYMLAHELKILARRQAQDARHWDKQLSGSLLGKRLGILGTGSIGQHIARAAKPFGLQIRGVNRSGLRPDCFSEIFDINELPCFFDNLDYLISTLPDTSTTEKMLDANAISQLPSHAVFINVGRSNVVDTNALADALQQNRLGGAILDVFDEEPLSPASPLWAVRNLQITAHIAAASHPLLIVPIFVENYRRFVGGRSLNYVIDFDKGY